MQGPNIVIHQSKKLMDNMNEWCIQHHGQVLLYVLILYVVRPSGSGVMSWTCDPVLALGLRLKFDYTVGPSSAPIPLQNIQ